jgi:lipid II:glycine glycyltransferase (peptidoglycan interpeptide bridge formation enzyme)
MVIRLREIGEADRDRYDDFVAANGGHVWQSFAWREVESARGWIPVRLMAEDADGEIAATVGGAKKVVAGRWAILDVAWGPVLDFTDGSAATVVERLKEYARENGVAHLRVNPEAANGEAERLLRGHGFAPARPLWRYKQTWRIDLRQSAEQILANMESKTRRLIGRAQRTGCTASCANSAEDFEAFLTLYRDTQRRRNRSGWANVALEVVWRLSRLRQLVVGYRDGQPYHALLLFTFGDRVWQGFSGSSGTVRAPGQLVNWTAVQWAKEHGYRDYDLGGKPLAPERREADSGIYRYKRGFGGREVTVAGEMAWSPNAAWGQAFRLAMAARSRLRGLLGRGGGGGEGQGQG